nr:hypothetical protein [uncultured Desulfobacter sp.]
MSTLTDKAAYTLNEEQLTHQVSAAFGEKAASKIHLYLITACGSGPDSGKPV